jgi:hypothetical protein
MLLQKRMRKRLLQVFLFNLGIFFSLKLTDNIPTSWLAATVDRQSSVRHSLQANLVQSLAMAVTPKMNAVLADGIYFYGQSSQPEQLGKEYLIFQVKRDKVKGALFMPQSEYDCWQGSIDRQNLNLSIEDGEGNNYDYQIALDRTAPVATNNNTSRNDISLRGYQSIAQIPATVKELLASCL